MQEYKIYEAEEKTTQSGKTLKKLVLQREGAQFPTKNVTIWSDNPLYDQAVAGASITCELIETDSGTPNPNAPGKNYINRSVANPNKPSPAKMSEMRSNTDNLQWFQALDRKISLIMEKLEVKDTKAEVEEKRDLTPDDIPF